jgi:hypothetical protein
MAETAPSGSVHESPVLRSFSEAGRAVDQSPQNNCRISA